MLTVKAPVLIFFVLGYAISWTLWFAADAIPSGGAHGLLILLGTFTPGLVALGLTRRSAGGEGVAAVALRELFSGEDAAAGRAGNRLDSGIDTMKGTIEKAWGYQGDNMNLPVGDLAGALPFYERVLGFRVVSREEKAPKWAVLARDDVQLRLVENGLDPTQDGCAFHVRDIESLFAEFRAGGLQKELSAFELEQRDNGTWKVFYVVAPDGLCYWFGERQASSGGDSVVVDG